MSKYQEIPNGNRVIALEKAMEVCLSRGDRGVTAERVVGEALVFYGFLTFGGEVGGIGGEGGSGSRKVPEGLK